MSRGDTDLPAPDDDGAARHLCGVALPQAVLEATDGRQRRLDTLQTRSVVFVYPGIGGPGDDELLEEWTAIPGARGCTAEACSFRDELEAFEGLAAEVLGLSGQSAADQRRHVGELALQYPLLSDEQMQLANILALPTFTLDRRRFYKRLTLVVANGRIEAALHPVLPPSAAAVQALEWLRAHPLP